MLAPLILIVLISDIVHGIVSGIEEARGNDYDAIRMEPTKLLRELPPLRG